MRFSCACLSVMALVGCNGGQPRLYRIAVDETPVQRENLAQTCFRTPPPGGITIRSTYQNVKFDSEWAVWDGAESKQFLDTAGRGWLLGDAPAVTLDGDLIESTDPLTFLGAKTITKTSANPNYTSTRTFNIKAAFAELGASARGNLEVSTTYSCSGACPDSRIENTVSCAVTLPFSGRRIDAQRMSGYSENPSGAVKPTTPTTTPAGAGNTDKL
jgi:hypothetical protein